MWSTPDAIRAAVREVMPSVRADLESLVRIPSVSADPARVDPDSDPALNSEIDRELNEIGGRPEQRSPTALNL